MLLFLLISLVPLSSAIFWDLLGGLGMSGCCRPPPPPRPPPCEPYPEPEPYMPPPMPSYMHPPRPYIRPPSPPPPPPPQPIYEVPQPQPYVPPPFEGYLSPGGYKRRTIRATEFTGVNSDVECNSTLLRKIMEKVITSDEAESRSNISTALMEHSNRTAVFCTSKPFKFTISGSTEFCAVKNDSVVCYAFVF